MERNPLAVARDVAMATILDWGIICNGPVAWAKNADWDQYLLRVENHSASHHYDVYLKGSMVTEVYQVVIARGRTRAVNKSQSHTKTLTSKLKRVPGWPL